MVNADIVLAFWDGHSKGTKFVIDQCKKYKVTVKIILLEKKNPSV